MATWSEFAAAAPDLADWGKKRLNRGRVAYLATVCGDGGPQVQPVAPIICQGHLFLFIEPDSPKGYDLCLDGRYAMHSLVENPSSMGGEFHLSGQAMLVDDPQIRDLATSAACYTPPEQFVLFELSIESALASEYEEGKPIHKKWEKKTA